LGDRCSWSCDGGSINGSGGDSWGIAWDNDDAIVSAVVIDSVLKKNQLRVWIDPCMYARHTLYILKKYMSMR
jgi:hypothetical protein